MSNVCIDSYLHGCYYVMVYVLVLVIYVSNVFNYLITLLYDNQQYCFDLVYFKLYYKMCKVVPYRDHISYHLDYVVDVS